MKFEKQSLTAKITNYIVLLALITVGIVGGVAYLTARKALEDDAFARLRVAATLKEAEINRWFESLQRDFLLTIQIPEVEVRLKQLLNDKIAGQQQQPQQYLSQYLAKVVAIQPSFREISIIDRSNKIIFSTNHQREGNYEILANITYVEQVELGDRFAPIFYVSPISHEPAITLAKTIVDAQGQRQGMVLVDINLERIDRIVREKTGLGHSGETYLVGSLVSKNAFISGNLAKIGDFPDGIVSSGIDAAMNGASGYGHYRNYAKIPVLGVYRWLNDQDIALLVEISQTEAFTPARQLAATIVLVGLMSVLGLLLGVNWLSRQLSLSRQKLEEYSCQLEVKAEEAEAANRSKSLFLANMSHELRTPLNAILGFAQLMDRDCNATSKQKEFLGIINRSGEHLLNLINDVLEMSKIEAGKTVLNLESFDVLLLLQTIQEMFEMRAVAKQLAFNLILTQNLPRYVVGDRRKLRQVLINLLSNAIKFTHTGAVTLKVDSDRQDDQTVKLSFKVSDTGKGIAKEELDKLFDPFVQTSSGIISEGGTGLGLAISRQFVQLMGGDIQATSIVDRGSSFFFDIPVSLADVAKIESEFNQPRVQHLAAGQSQYRILVADDKPANRQLLIELLQTVGFNTHAADNGKEAISIWQEWQPHLIWMDMRMPLVDGYQATKYIKSQSQGTDTVIIALTASAFEEERERILSAGCDDFVRKPFTEQVIFDKMAQYLGVEYLYDSKQTPSSSTETSDNSLTKQDLSFLSPEWIGQLHQAAIAVDSEQIEQLVAQISASHQSIAQTIIHMTRNYDFDAIIELTENNGFKVI